LPYVSVRLNALIPEPILSPPETLGEHLKKRRLKLGLSQEAAAAQLGVNPFTVLNWEKGRTEPPVRALAIIVRWLGYDPLPEPTTLQERMKAARAGAGWTVVEAARRLGVDPATWGHWERTGQVPWARYRDRLDKFLAKIQRLYSPPYK